MMIYYRYRYNINMRKVKLFTLLSLGLCASAQFLKDSVPVVIGDWTVSLA